MADPAVVDRGVSTPGTRPVMRDPPADRTGKIMFLQRKAV